uniref:PiggyBac transposable element-derived protein domain-containing protein n=1 Tax=Romanomermis culicivorax TaxID=13658 RepID=A0A915JKI1_ROMCU
MFFSRFKFNINENWESRNIEDNVIDTKMVSLNSVARYYAKNTSFNGWDHIGNKDQIPFPAVTICSLNPIRKSQIYRVPKLNQLLSACEFRRNTTNILVDDAQEQGQNRSCRVSRKP